MLSAVKNVHNIMVKGLKDLMISAFTWCFRKNEETNKMPERAHIPPEPRIRDPKSVSWNTNAQTVTFNQDIQSGYKTLHIDPETEQPSSTPGQYESIKLTEQENDPATDSISHDNRGYSRLIRQGMSPLRAHLIQPEPQFHSARDNQQDSVSPLNKIPKKARPPIPLPFRQSSSADLLKTNDDQTTILISGRKVNIPRSSVHAKKAMIPPARNNSCKPGVSSGADISSRDRTFMSKKRVLPSTSSVVYANFVTEKTSTERECPYSSDYYELEIDFNGQQNSATTERDNSELEFQYSYAAPARRQVQHRVKTCALRSDYDDNLRITTTCPGI